MLRAGASHDMRLQDETWEASVWYAATGVESGLTA